MALLGRRDQQEGSVEDERDALRRQRVDAARELGTLKKELAERVAAVKARERQLEEALAKAASGSPIPAGILPRPEPVPDAALAARVATLERREKQLAAREARLAGADPEALERRAHELAQGERAAAARTKELDEREQALAELERDPDEEKLRRIEERLAELKEAERIFLRTQQELADRSEAVAARERLIATRERELDERDDGWQGQDLSELERRLRRLEQGPGEITQSFTGGLSKLRQEGTRRPPS